MISYKIPEKNIILIAGFILAIATAIAIADGPLIYLFLFFGPLLIYLCLKHPVIFPFGVYAFLLPFDSILELTGSKQGPTVTKFLGVLSILVFLLTGSIERKFIKPDKTVIWWTLFILIGALSVCWCENIKLVISRIPTSIGLLLFYLVIASYYFQRKEYETLKWFIFSGGFVASIVIIYIYLSGETLARTTLQVGERTADPNWFAFGLLFPISICFEKILNTKNKSSKILSGVVLAVMLFAVIVTGSRGAFLGVVIISVFYIFSIKRKMAFAILLIFIGLALMSFIPQFFVERWKQAVDSGGTGRMSIWYVGLLALKKYFLIGAGLNNFPEAYTQFANYAPKYKGVARASHNIFLGLFVETGILGFSLLVWGLAKHYFAIDSIRIRRNDLNAIMLRSTFWAVLVSSLFLDTFWDKSFWLLWMMILINRNCLKNEIRGLIQSGGRP